MTVTITANQVKELRERTGVGMMECKKALTENEGSMDKAILWLRERGLSRAAAKSTRAAAQGVVEIAISPDQSSGIAIEVNSETDFVANNPEFKSYAKTIAELALSKKAKNIDEIKNLKLTTGKTAQETLTELVARIGENMQLRRVSMLHTTNGVVAGYVHGGGKIGVLVAVDGGKGDQVTAATRDIAMHVAASSPRYLQASDVPASELEQEKELGRSKLLEEKKPAEMVEKILAGQMQKFYKEICLVDQPFVKDPAVAVSKYLTSVGPTLKVSSFVRFGLGEGIEKKEENFADEVAKTLGNK